MFEHWVKTILKQDGPSLESSSYLNVSLRYFGPYNPWTLEPLDLGTLKPLPSPTPTHTSSYLFLLLSSFGMVWHGGGYSWVLTLEIEIRDGLLTCILMLKSLWVGGWWVELDYSVSSGPFWALRLQMDQDPSLTIIYQSKTSSPCLLYFRSSRTRLFNR